MKKQYIGLYENYKRATATELWQVYGRYSVEKIKALQECKELQYNMGGYDGRICTHSAYLFSYAFRYINESGRQCLAYITKGNKRFFEID